MGAVVGILLVSIETPVFNIGAVRISGVGLCP